jgi:hypothetical protein
MNSNPRRTPGLLRSSTALAAATLLLGSLTLGACSKAGPENAFAAPPQQQVAATAAAADGDTIDLVDAALESSDAADPARGASDRKRLRAMLLRALHATWVTNSPNGPVTHQAVRGGVTAVSATSITVQAKDGFALTYAVTPDTTVRSRAKGAGTPSSIAAVKVGSTVLVTGVGATKPTARLVVFRSATPRPAGTPSPSATS